MARNSKEKDSTYNKAYYERLKADPERIAERLRKSTARRVRKNKLDRIVRWENILLEIASKRGMSHRQIAEEIAEEFNVVKVKKGKTEQWIDFSPLKEKSLSSSSSSSATAHPVRTQEGAK